MVDLDGQTSLVTLKKYLEKECGEVYVERNYERIKGELKEMFKREEIHPANRLKRNKKPSVSVSFKFGQKKSSKAALANAKMVQKNAKAKNKK